MSPPGRGGTTAGAPTHRAYPPHHGVGHHTGPGVPHRTPPHQHSCGTPQHHTLHHHSTHCAHCASAPHSRHDTTLSTARQYNCTTPHSPHHSSTPQRRMLCVAHTVQYTQRSSTAHHDEDTVTTSRTGTTKWKHVAAQAKRKAQAQGQDTCPLCNVILDYSKGKQPNSAEADHIIEWSKGGQDTLDNVRIICRQCNQKRGGKTGHKKSQRKRTQPLRLAPAVTTDRW